MHWDAMRSECKRRLGPARTPVLIRLSGWVDAIEKKKCNTAMALSDDGAPVVACHTTMPQRLRGGPPPPDLATIKAEESLSKKTLDRITKSVSNSSLYFGNATVHAISRYLGKKVNGQPPYLQSDSGSALADDRIM